jgi:hypothetical protein
VQDKDGLLNAQQHMDKAIERAYKHEVICFDHQTGTYEVIQRDGTTSDGEVRESRRHVVVIQDFSCTCGAPRQYHFPCSHMVAACNHRNFAWQSLIPREFSVENLILTWSPRFVPFRDSGSSQLQDAPLTQDSPRRSTHPPNRYTPGTDALGKGKGKTKRGTWVHPRCVACINYIYLLCIMDCIMDFMPYELYALWNMCWYIWICVWTCYVGITMIFIVCLLSCWLECI